MVVEGPQGGNESDCTAVLRFASLPAHELAAAFGLGLAGVVWLEPIKRVRRRRPAQPPALQPRGRVNGALRVPACLMPLKLDPGSRFQNRVITAPYPVSS